MIFRKEINPYSVTDKVTFRNVDQTITLKVRADATAIVVGLKQVNERLSGMNDNTPEEERRDAARAFATVIFGADQGETLMNFYLHDYLAVISACGAYFGQRLGKIITKAQKKK